MQGSRMMTPPPPPFLWHLTASPGMSLSLCYISLPGFLCIVTSLSSQHHVVKSRCGFKQSHTPGGAPRPWTRRGELPLRTMVLPLLLKLLNVFLRQSTLSKAATSDHCRRPSCCPASLMPRPPGLPLSCRRGWEAREHPQRLPAEEREVRTRDHWSQLKVFEAVGEEEILLCVNKMEKSRNCLLKDILRKYCTSCTCCVNLKSSVGNQTNKILSWILSAWSHEKF